LRDLEDDLRVTNLGIFNVQPDATAILNRVKLLNSDLDDTQVEVILPSNIDNSSKFATINVIADSTVYNVGEIVVTYQVIALHNLRDDISTNYLGTFTGTPTEEEIMSRFTNMNPNINLHEVEITFSEEQVFLRVKVGSRIYNRSASAFTYRVLHSLNEELTETNLGEFYGNPHEGILMDRVRELNKDIFASEVQIVERSLQPNGQAQAILRVRENSTIYAQADVLIFYTVIELTNIANVVHANDNHEASLGDFRSAPTSNDILLKINSRYPEVDLSQIRVANI
jgi:hypothetical protein